VALGFHAGDLGSATVSNDGFLETGLLIVGLDGHGQLTIDGGSALDFSEVLSTSGQMGVGTGGGTGSGFVTITQGQLGTPAVWHVTGDCVVGLGESGSVFLNANAIISFHGANLIVDGTLFVNAGGLINGNGTLTTAPGHRVLNGGIISPGLSPGVIEIDGDYEQTADGLLEMEAAGTAPGDFDFLHVTGNATLGGTLQVTFLNGYLPKTGDVLPFLQIDGTLTGDFAQVTFPQLAPGFQAQEQFVNGTLELVALNDAISGEIIPTVIAQINSLIGTITNSSLKPKGLKTSLNAKLRAAFGAVEVGDIATACNKLQDFINQVNAQKGRKIPVNFANSLISSARQILSELGCG